jgi:hypothetical protein
VALFSAGGQRELRRLVNDADWYRENLHPFHFGYFDQSSRFLLACELRSIATALMLLSDACEDFQQSL